MLRATFVIALGLCVAGCGAAERITRTEPACPEGTEKLTATKVIGPLPRGYEACLRSGRSRSGSTSRA